MRNDGDGEMSVQERPRLLWPSTAVVIGIAVIFAKTALKLVILFLRKRNSTTLNRLEYVRPEIVSLTNTINQYH